MSLNLVGLGSSSSSSSSLVPDWTLSLGDAAPAASFRAGAFASRESTGKGEGVAATRDEIASQVREAMEKRMVEMAFALCRLRRLEERASSVAVDHS